MNKKTYSTIPQIGPARFVPQLLGGLAGGVGGFLNARQEAKAAGEKLTFKSAIDDILLGRLDNNRRLVKRANYVEG